MVLILHNLATRDPAPNQKDSAGKRDTMSVTWVGTCPLVCKRVVEKSRVETTYRPLRMEPRV